MSFEHIERKYRMTSERFDYLVQIGMTHSEWIRTKKSLHFLSEKGVRCNLKDKSEIRACADAFRQIARDGWDTTLQGCIAEAVKRFPDWPAEKRHEYAWSKAELILVETGYVPPHFTQWCKCKGCGLVPLSTKSEKEVLTCAWCESGWFVGDVADEQ